MCLAGPVSCNGLVSRTKTHQKKKKNIIMLAIKNRTKAFFKGKRIQVPDEWITACIEWLQSEEPDVNLNNGRIISEKIYEQWLYADLTELGTNSLPFGLARMTHTTITGHFAVQVNQVCNIGMPAYSQLQKVQRTDVANASVSADQPHQPAWEPKPTRMLMMQITDGTSVVQGMEYRVIPCLNVNLKPGTKLLLSGSIDSRRGILLLTRDHVTVLGGEVESLLLPNAMENVLARTLGVEETENPREYEDNAPTQPLPASQVSQYYPSQLNSVTNNQRNNQNMQLSGRGASSQNRVMQNAVRTSSSTSNVTDFDDDLGDDDFLDDDLEAAINQIEHQATSSSSTSRSLSTHQNQNAIINSSLSSRGTGRTGTQTQNNNKNQHFSNDRAYSSTSRSVTHSGEDLENSDLGMEVDDAFFDDDFDEEILITAERQVGPLSQQPQISLSASVSALPRKNNAFKQTSIRESDDVSRQSSTNFGSQHTRVPGVRMQTAQTSAGGSVSSSRFGTSLTPASKLAKSQGKQSSMKNFLVKTSGPSIKQEQAFNSNPQILDEFPGSDDDFDDFEVVSDKKEISHSKINSSNPNEFLTPVYNPGLRKLSTGSSHKEIMRTRSVSESVQQEPPFTYLHFLPERPTTDQKFVVKGFIMTLVSRLEQFEGRWRLTVLINDGTASREVDIDDQVLRKLIGWSAEEITSLKLESKSNPESRARLAKSVTGCQQELISLCSLLQITVSPRYARPRLTALIPVTADTYQNLAARVSVDS